MVLAATLAIGLIPALTPPSVLAARPGLTFVTETTYDVQPAESRVSVTVRLTAHNHMKDTAARKYFFRTGFLTVLPGTSGFRISGGSGAPKVSVSEVQSTYTNLRIDLGANLAAGKSTTLDLAFDLLDPGGAPDRAIRISPSLVSFDAWAFATPETPGSSVAVRLPTGYAVAIGRGPMTGPNPDGDGFVRWSTEALASPLEFVADVDADRPPELVETSQAVRLADGEATVVLRAWPDDPAWRDRVGSLVERALPLLEAAIGIPWPVDGPLAIHELIVRGAGGYAGLFDPTERRIDISYAAPDGVVLHELAHAWFNGRLVADRWAAEAFASYYAEVVATELQLVATPPSPAQPGEETIPLNAWGHSGSDSPAAETYAYFASLELAHAISERARPAQLRRVWARAAEGLGAYGGAAPADGAAVVPVDWRALLDLLEDETGEPFEDLWRAWVARPEDMAALADRVLARGAYERSAQLAADWQLPQSVHDAMRTWQFDEAEELLAVADAVHERRAGLEASASAAGLTLPDVLRERFEGPDGPGAALAAVAAAESAVDAIVDARAARPPAGGIGDQLIAGIGLLTAQPEEKLVAAEAAFAAGDLAFAKAAAELAEHAWQNAVATGWSRIVSAVLLFLAILLLTGLVRQRRRRSAKPS